MNMKLDDCENGGAGRRLVMRLMKNVGLGWVSNPAVRALKRKNKFSSVDEAREYFSGHDFQCRVFLVVCAQASHHQ